MLWSINKRTAVFTHSPATYQHKEYIHVFLWSIHERAAAYAHIPPIHTLSTK